jgi:hypothetical protein
MGTEKNTGPRNFKNVWLKNSSSHTRSFVYSYERRSGWKAIKNWVGLWLEERWCLGKETDAGSWHKWVKTVDSLST